MIIAPLDWNLLADGTVTTAADRFELGHPAANLFTADPREQAVWRGSVPVSAGFASLQLGATTFSIADGVYDTRAELCEAVAAAATTATGQTWYCAVIQGGANRGKVRLWTTGAAATLTVTSALAMGYYALGFIAGTRSSATEHIADYVQARGNARSLGGGHDFLQIDLGEDKYATWAFFANPRLGPGGTIALYPAEAASGTALWTDAQLAAFNGGREVEWLGPVSAMRLRSADFGFGGRTLARYWRIFLADPRNPERVGLGLAWVGEAVDTEDQSEQWEWSSWRLETEPKTTTRDSLNAHPEQVESRPVERFMIAWDAAPGASPRIRHRAQELAEACSGGALAFFAPARDRLSEARLVRFVAPSLTRQAMHTGLGRWRYHVEAEAVRF